MYKDWSFWLAIITALTAIIAIFQTSRQIRLSNRQFLFDRRLSAYIIVNGIIKLCEENKINFDDYKVDTQWANDTIFVSFTNNAYMEQSAYAIKNVLKKPFHQEFLRKREELRKFATEIEFIFMGKEASICSEFILNYERVLYRMYQYQIVLNHMEEENDKNSMASEKLINMFNETEYRKNVHESLHKLQDTYSKMKVVNEKLRKQIALIKTR